VFITRPISAALLVVAVGALVLAVLPAIRRRRDVVFQEEAESAIPVQPR
jgi:putative tricarboxylic transport membrane protein